MYLIFERAKILGIANALLVLYKEGKNMCDEEFKIVYYDDMSEEEAWARLEEYEELRLATKYSNDDDNDSDSNSDCTNQK